LILKIAIGTKTLLISVVKGKKQMNLEGLTNMMPTDISVGADNNYLLPRLRGVFTFVPFSHTND